MRTAIVDRFVLNEHDEAVQQLKSVTGQFDLAHGVAELVGPKFGFIASGLAQDVRTPRGSYHLSVKVMVRLRKGTLWRAERWHVAFKEA